MEQTAQKLAGVARTRRLEHLDMLRGLAAMLVLGNHLRAYVFVNYGSLGEANAVTTLFYAATGLGHQAVIVFFALSGFLVGGHVIEAMGNANWSWTRYLLRRLTRLWIVIIPALVATAILDRIGLSLTGGTGYDGTLYDIYVSGPSVTDGIDLSTTTFIGNLAFLQTIAVPAYGTNLPIWSLANEFWYYILFPLFLGVFFVTMHALQRIFSIVLLLILIAWLPAPLLMAGIVWLAGALAARVQSSALFRDNYVRAALVVAIVATLYLTKQSDADAWTKIVFGIAVALALPALAQLPTFGRRYRILARAAAEVSYTVYLTHFSFLTLIAFTSLAPPRFHPGFAGAFLYIGLFLAALVWAAILWWCFERHTDRLYGVLAARLPHRTTDRES
jgi:peptidoglycan/LPS O-acetylase OafA/YrhL